VRKDDETAAAYSELAATIASEAFHRVGGQPIVVSASPLPLPCSVVSCAALSGEALCCRMVCGSIRMPSLTQTGTSACMILNFGIGQMNMCSGIIPPV
jgi:hypothetical protein